MRDNHRDEESDHCEGGIVADQAHGRPLSFLVCQCRQGVPLLPMS